MAQLTSTYGRSATGMALRSEGGQEPVAERVHPPDRGALAGFEARLPPPAGDPVQYGRIAGHDGDRHVPAGVLAGDHRSGLVVAEEHQHRVVVAVLLQVGDERAQRVLDGAAVVGPDPARVAPLLGRRGALVAGPV